MLNEQSNYEDIDDFYKSTVRSMEALKSSYEEIIAQKDAEVARFQKLLAKERELSVRLLS